MPSNHLVSVIPFSCLQSFPASEFFYESALCIRGPKYWSFGLSISPSNEYSGLISFRTDWFNLLAVQGILKSLLKHHSLEASILWLSAFFMVQHSHPYVTTGKTIALTKRTFVGKVMSLLFNMLLLRKRILNSCSDEDSVARLWYQVSLSKMLCVGKTNPSTSKKD